ncbi:MAG: PTS sugar transporter subunit IIA [Planctomycetota bacterium]
MKFRDFIIDDAVVMNLQSVERDDAIAEMVEGLKKSGKVGDEHANEIVKALLKRERLGSTGIGKGVAVPHAKHGNVRGLMGAFGKSEKGIEFNALDGEKVYCVFMLLSHADASGPHLQALAYISNLLRDDRFCRFLRDAKTKSDILDLFTEADQRTTS